MAGLADRGLILRSGLSGRVLLRRWLLLSRRLLCLALSLLALGLPATLACRRLVLRHWRVRLTIRLSGRVLLRAGLAVADRGRLASGCGLAALLANPVRQPQCGDRAGINAAGRLDALLSLEADQRLLSPRSQHSVRFTGEQAPLDEHLLDFPDLRRAEIKRRDRTASNAASAEAVAEVRSRSGRDNVNHSAVSVQKHDFVLHDEEAVIAETREHVDQRREGPDRHDVDVRRHDRARVDRKVNAVDVNARRVSG